MKRAVFLSIAGDFHASVVGQTLLEQCGRGLKLSIIDMDERSVKGGFVWRSDTPGAAACSTLVKDNAGDWVALDETDLVWCRRFARAQRGGDEAGFLTDQWNAAGWSLAHLARTRWIDRPRDIIEAENKALQLSSAHEVGFRVPRTLISQDFEQVRAFVQAEPEGVIVKPLKGSVRKQIYTVDLAQDGFDRPDGFSAFPAIYQQKIGGDHHWRIVCLPDTTTVFALRSPELDWRRTRNVDIEKIETDAVIAEQCGSLLRRLRLTMGIIDAKVVGDDVYFLEINPQGQFLFLEALSGVNLRSAYADYFRHALFASA